MASRSSVASMVPSSLPLAAARKSSPTWRAGEPIGWPSFVVFVAQLEPTAAEPEAAVAKSTAEAEAPAEAEAAVTEFTAEPKVAAAESTTAEPEAPAEAAPAEAASAKADHVNVGPASAVTPTSTGNGRLTPTFTGNGRRTQRRAGCGDRHGDQTNRYLAHHDARFHSF
jgi:hypothetical protein